VRNYSGGQPAVQIRGQRSISGSNDPLILLDGVIYLGSVSDINPNDIASYDILKDAVSAGGLRFKISQWHYAINTKKGKMGKPAISVRAEAEYKMAEPTGNDERHRVANGSERPQ
jgi:hypothetical protein